MKKIAIALAGMSMTGVAFAGSAVYSAPAATTVAPTSEISYNNFELDYAMTWFDDSFLDDAIGAKLGVEYNIVQHLYFAAGGTYQNVDSSSGTTDLWTANAGLGVYYTLANNFDFVVEGGALFYGIDNSPYLGGSDDDVSGYVKPHFRALFGDRYEVHFGAVWSNIDYTNEWAGFGKLYIGLAEGWDLSLGFNFGDFSYQGTVGFRYQY